MKKIEIIWRELLYQSLEKGNNCFVQKDLAQKFKFSTSTIFQALKPLRKMGAVKVSGRNFTLTDPEKLLYHWASLRQLNKEIVYQTQVDLPVLEIEKSMPSEVVFACFSAYRLRFNDTPADFDQVWVYGHDLKEIKKRFPEKKGMANLVVLKPDTWLVNYGQITSLAQTFVDLWNLPSWFAKEFVNSLKEKIDDLLS
jgi:hypothetical protein